MNESPNNTIIAKPEGAKKSKGIKAKTGKLGGDLMTSEDSFFGNSETYSYSISTNKRSPSQFETFS